MVSVRSLREISWYISPSTICPLEQAHLVGGENGHQQQDADGVPPDFWELG